MLKVHQGFNTKILTCAVDGAEAVRIRALKVLLPVDRADTAFGKLGRRLFYAQMFIDRVRRQHRQGNWHYTCDMHVHNLERPLRGVIKIRGKVL